MSDIVTSESRHLNRLANDPQRPISVPRQCAQNETEVVGFDYKLTICAQLFELLRHLGEGSAWRTVKNRPEHQLGGSTRLRVFNESPALEQYRNRNFRLRMIFAHKCFWSVECREISYGEWLH